MKEEWRKVTISDNYEISNLGRVKRLARVTKAWNRHKVCERKLPELILKNCYDSDGYHIVGIDGKNQKVHRLVTIAFIPNPENKPQVNHINGIKDDNRVDNLEWNTPAENYQHAYDTKLNLGPLGSSNVASKLNKDDVLTIKWLLESSKGSQKSIAEQFEVTSSTISSIKRGETWSHITGYKYNGRNKVRKK